MKAAIWKSINNIVVKNIDIPKIENDEVLIKVAYAGVCGSDITVFSGKHLTAKPPVILGHEFSGIVAESKSSYFKKGDRVVVEPIISCGICEPCIKGNDHICSSLKVLGIHENGAFADYVKADANRSFKIPDNMQLFEAAMIEPFSVALHSIDSSHMKVGDSVLIVGAGPIGIMTGLLALYYGARKVIISDLSEFRLEFAKKIGMIPFNPNNNGDLTKYILDNTDNNGIDIAFECAGTKSSVKACLDNLGIKGKLIQVGIPKELIETDYRNLAYKEQEIIGVRVYPKGVFMRAINFLSDRNIILKDFVSNIFDLDNIIKAFECTNDKNRSLKVLISF